jgi:hypothetical protein
LVISSSVNKNCFIIISFSWMRSKYIPST